MTSDDDKLRLLAEALSSEIGRLTLNNFSFQVELSAVQQELASAAERIANLNAVIADRDQKIAALTIDRDNYRTLYEARPYKTVGRDEVVKKGTRK